ncbi:hypothetical protein H5410_044665 [Solanum commersonii]|uniref:Uncharacterized protein n=1 Tax=Solanum commersonii TaxID=4109 RepID=A0A9J5X982_SOLCO|nr:hypothetical protein H5410_044665 [Solanum commersonii]
MIDCQGNAPAKKKLQNAPAGKEFHLISSIVKVLNILKTIRNKHAKLQRTNDDDSTVTEPDKPLWRLHSRGVFTVKSCYWERNTNHFLTAVWPWKIKVPLKVACFTWLKTEVNGHLFLHCKIATDLWNMFVCILGVNWTMPRTTFEVLTHWQGIGKRGSKEDWWKNIPACIWWTLWKERNGRCYEGKVSSPQEIKMRCLSLLYFWCKQNLVGEVDSLVEFKSQL